MANERILFGPKMEFLPKIAYFGSKIFLPKILDNDRILFGPKMEFLTKNSIFVGSKKIFDVKCWPKVDHIGQTF